MKRGTAMTHVNNYVEHKCKGCGQTYEVRVDKQNTLYGDYCPLCFHKCLIEDIYGSVRLKRDDEKIKNIDYKDELQGVTHRGKTRIQED
jgi:hypothetical protein